MTPLHQTPALPNLGRHCRTTLYRIPAESALIYWRVFDASLSSEEVVGRAWIRPRCHRSGAWSRGACVRARPAPASRFASSTRTGGAGPIAGYYVSIYRERNYALGSNDLRRYSSQMSQQSVSRNGRVAAGKHVNKVLPLAIDSTNSASVCTHREVGKSLLSLRMC